MSRLMMYMNIGATYDSQIYKVIRVLVEVTYEALVVGIDQIEEDLVVVLTKEALVVGMDQSCACFSYQ